MENIISIRIRGQFERRSYVPICYGLKCMNLKQQYRSPSLENGGFSAQPYKIAQNKTFI